MPSIILGNEAVCSWEPEMHRSPDSECELPGDLTDCFSESVHLAGTKIPHV